MRKFTEYDECTRFRGHFSGFATKSFTAEADLQANICLKIGLGRETFSCKTTKVSVKSCGNLSNRVEHYFAGRTTTL